MTHEPHDSLQREPAQPRRGDDADARGEHDYGRPLTPRPDEGDVAPPLRPSDTYAAGENGTQQVNSGPARDKPVEHGKP